MKQFGRSVGLGLGALVLFAAVFTVLVTAQAPQQPAQPMSFFVTSAPKGDGANYGGLAGADAYCQQLAAAAGRGAAKWVAYLSTQGPGAVNARDRIGNGPWYNARGAMIAANQAELHGDTIEQARLGNRLNKNSARTEKGDVVNGVGDMPNQHDILTGSHARRARLHRRRRSHLQQLDQQRQRGSARARRGAAGYASGARPFGAVGTLTTRRAAATVPGTPRTAAAAAASRTWSRRAARGCCTASLRTRSSQSKRGPDSDRGPALFFGSRLPALGFRLSCELWVVNCEFGPAP